ncbi:Flagellar assembly factor FliW [Arthrobacter ulcerisalmonis]|uniref:Flagellar assembly factor FliW n=1 Tax=Arthrobacter ulcerisalmonis TaxID=2483813 RepID=A0A3P5WX47_9MICC|nr:flagellar assembly protein FliW [Arthrobacter ulcerisalmonis]VDC23631.1 Flagellar assembly factor FliW [Arthrobacter ulcerisalmonis]
MSTSTQTAGGVTFTAPMPGLAGVTDFSLRPIPETDGLYALEGSGSFSVRLFLADAALFVPDYAPPVPARVLLELGLAELAAGQILVVVNPADSGTTVNLMAPVVLNAATGTCTQVVLESNAYPLQHLLT